MIKNCYEPEIDVKEHCFSQGFASVQHTFTFIINVKASISIDSKISEL